MHFAQRGIAGEQAERVAVGDVDQRGDDALDAVVPRIPLSKIECIHLGQKQQGLAAVVEDVGQLHLRHRVFEQSGAQTEVVERLVDGQCGTGADDGLAQREQQFVQCRRRIQRCPDKGGLTLRLLPVAGDVANIQRIGFHHVPRGLGQQFQGRDGHVLAGRFLPLGVVRGLRHGALVCQCLCGGFEFFGQVQRLFQGAVHDTVAVGGDPRLAEQQPTGVLQPSPLVSEPLVGSAEHAGVQQ